MDRKLLAQGGIILADNVLSLGCTVDSEMGAPQSPAVRNGAELRKFNNHIAEVYIFRMYD
jgi:predicted O-methyltransferase YrrM